MRSFAAGFSPSFRRALAGALPGGKTLLLVLALAVPPAILAIVQARHDDPWRTGRALYWLVQMLYLNLLVPLSAVLFGTAVLREEENAGNLPFLFTRPVPRSSILFGRWLAFVLIGGAALAASLVASVVLARGGTVPEGFFGRAFASVLLAFPPYLAAFAFLSALTRWAVLGGFFYAFGLETFIGFIPGMVRRATLLYYSRSLLGDWTIPRPGRTSLPENPLFGAEGPAEAARAVPALLLVSAVGLLLMFFFVKRTQFAGRNPGRA